MLTQSQIPMDTNTLLNTATDCLRFVTEFFEVISQSGPHIYHSALQLTPQLSIVWELYNQQICSPVARVVVGIPSSWDLCTASVENTHGEHCAVWSPCGQFVAVGSATIVEVRDSNTLERVSVLRSLFNIAPISITFSHDGYLITCLYNK